MKLYKIAKGIIIEFNEKYYFKSSLDWDNFVNKDNLYQQIKAEIPQLNEIEFGEEILTPIGTQEIWASGVTYMRSREARMEESKDSGAAVFYSHVYEAERPELFFKSSYFRASGPDEPVYIRKDSQWNVPEPELTLFASTSGKIVGYTIGNDMSSRDIEGENPLYLPQAKCYERAAAIGPCLYVPESPIAPDTTITMTIIRKEKEVFQGQISINQMKRKHTELIEFLFREMHFPNGVYLMTGTCLVPDDTFSLQVDDQVKIKIPEIGELTNTVAMMRK
ncbi:Fumarylacetoacetate hydrolase family protein [Indibacter alkaliphilus LW1]|jgi:2-dehydro-3-deoxy-D-arabinonate dehydratase|uniref:Fumarylacetoacetate hydrolase family protein n=1 Tax=Indibacter alkaliphilus (strain CCUG 57479 / KCTC 22604 / LW1) TaxID=1189612 RepID=S2DHG4_INDAL|nr:fumarylacetoacetate hydrolase family protein [Indibacter alkaliphilus]EOZ98439.1 Fumarylacetoacetate hydrolase family protein [Indibacter alkaliphilus LW1]